MTRDDIIRMARDVGFVDIHHERVWIREGYHEVRLERFAALVAAAERESCAQVCENVPVTWTLGAYNSACHDCADAIRARSQG
jgi:hypothetical protein